MKRYAKSGNSFFISKPFNYGMGIVISLISLCLLFFVFSAVLSFSSVSDSLIPLFCAVSVGFSAFWGAFFSCRRIGNNGLKNGCILGFTLVIIHCVCIAAFGSDSFSSFVSYLFLFEEVLFSVLGGIIGVNSVN